MRLLVIFLLLFLAACTKEQKQVDISNDNNPIPLENLEEIDGVYIPKDLDDCFSQLDKLLDPADIEKIRSGEVTSIDMHFGLGMSIRNNWGLWGTSRLAKYLNGHSISHPDAMSRIILEGYASYLRNEPVDINELKTRPIRIKPRENTTGRRSIGNQPTITID